MKKGYNIKTCFFFVGICIFLLLKDVDYVRAATLKCSPTQATIEVADHKADTANSTEEYDVKNNYGDVNKNSLNKLFQNIQCTLEKAKPWMAELQQEATRLEEAAKLLGLGILNSFDEFVDKLVEETAETSTNIQSNSTASEENLVNSTEIVDAEISQYLCPEGFIADHNGICERVH